MWSDNRLSTSDLRHLSPDLQAQGAAYQRSRADKGVDDDRFDVAGARAALLDNSGDRHDPGLFGQKQLGDLTVFTVRGSGPTLLYLHGGGFVGGSVRTHGHIATEIALHTNAPAVFPEYRLAPEHRFPAAFDDTDSTFAATTGPVVLAGDSVGGALAVHLALNHPDRARIQAIALLAPMLAFDTKTSEYMRTHGRARAMIAHAVQPGETGDPRLCPTQQDLSQLPPTLIQIGGADYVRSDGLSFATAAMTAGAPVVLENWPHMPHVWHRYAPNAPEARRSLSRAARFLATHSNALNTDPKH